MFLVLKYLMKNTIIKYNKKVKYIFSKERIKT